MNTPGASDSGLELARPVDVLSLTHGDSQHTLRASAAECEALAKRFSVDQLQHLTATLTLTRSGSEKSLRMRVQGSLDAAIVQTCVVSLEPFPSHIVCEIDAVFDARAGQETTHQDLDPLARRQLARGVLSLDPFLSATQLRASVELLELLQLFLEEQISTPFAPAAP